MSAVFLLDFFDFFLIAFVMSVIGPEWRLTYAQGALILYGAGIGAIIGSLIWGSLGDRFGRKPQTVTGTLLCGVSAGLIGLVPTGHWESLAVLRFFVGFGLAAGVTPALTIVVEQTPTRWRTGMTSFYVVFASAGTLLASFIAAALLHAFGWRGVAMTGFVAVAIGLLVWAFVPESVRWLTAKGRFAEARAGVARQLNLPLVDVPLPAARPAAEPRANLLELFSVNPRLFWQTIVIWGGSSSAAYGYYLWGPTIVALALLAGSGNVIAPKATAAAVFPAFVFLGAMMLAVALAFLFLGIETHGRAMVLGPDRGRRRSRPPALGSEAR